MSASLLSHLHVRPELFRKGQPVYLRNPEEEMDPDSRAALAHLRGQIGVGPFQALRISDTPSSKAAPQCVTISNMGCDTPLKTQEGDLQVTGYYLSSDPQ